MSSNPNAEGPYIFIKDGVKWFFPQTFMGFRPEPPLEYVQKGVTNSGVIPDYEGVIYSDGTVVVRWMTHYKSCSVWSSWDDFYSVHGHPEYKTELFFSYGDGPDYQEVEAKR